MIIYLAGNGLDQLEMINEVGGTSGTANMLWSYFEMRKRPSLISDHFDQFSKLTRFFLDSGAFSAFHRGGKIDIDQYAACINLYKGFLTLYANLDVIGDWQGTIRNQRYLESKGLKPLPVFHANGQAPLTVLRDMCMEYDYIAIGGVAGKMGRGVRTEMLDRAWAAIHSTWKQKATRVKVHGFGVTSTDLLERYPWYSVDSTSWLIGQRTGTIMHWNGKEMIAGHHTDPATVHDHRRFIAGGQKSWRQRSIYCGEQFMKAEKFFTELWRRRGVSWED